MIPRFIYTCLLLTPAFVCECGGATSDSTSGNSSTPKGATTLAQVDDDSLNFVASNSDGIYWSNFVHGGIFRISRDATGLTQLNADLNPDALSATDGRLYWRSYTDATLSNSRLSTSLDDGSQRQDDASGFEMTVGSWNTGTWTVPSDGQYIYWLSAPPDGSTQHILRVAISDGTQEVLYERTDNVGIGLVWLAANTLYFNDNNGVHSVDLATKAEADALATNFTVVNPVYIGSDFYFVGNSPDVAPLTGLFRVQAGVASRIGSLDWDASYLRAAGDGSPYIYLLDRHDASVVKIHRYDTTNDTFITLQEFQGESSISNIIVDGDYLVFGLRNRVMRMPKNPQ